MLICAHMVDVIIIAIHNLVDLFSLFKLVCVFSLCRFIENPLPHTTVLNLFTQHGWLLATAFQSNSIPFGSSSPAPSDTLVFTHPIHKES